MYHKKMFRLEYDNLTEYRHRIRELTCFLKHEIKKSENK